MTGNRPTARSSILDGARTCGALVLAGALLLILTSAPARAEGPEWQQLTVAERQVLAPLASQWDGIDQVRKEKWRDIAVRYPGLSVAEQQRVQSRMSEWARLGAAERGKARLGYQEARQLPVDERQARWQAYQSLPPEQRRELAERAAERAGAPSRGASAGPTRVASAASSLPAKSNVVANPQVAPSQARPVAPGVVQAPAGATTRTVNQRPTPPSHQPPGLPKITASPGFVDRNTLLPQRGAQGAAVIEADEKKKPQP